MLLLLFFRLFLFVVVLVIVVIVALVVLLALVVWDPNCFSLEDGDLYGSGCRGEVHSYIGLFSVFRGSFLCDFE